MLSRFFICLEQTSYISIYKYLSNFAKTDALIKISFQHEKNMENLISYIIHIFISLYCFHFFLQIQFFFIYPRPTSERKKERKKERKNERKKERKKKERKKL